VFNVFSDFPFPLLALRAFLFGENVKNSKNIKQLIHRRSKDMIGYKLDFDRFQKAKRISDSELARRMNKSRATIGNLRGRRSIDFETLTQLCMILEVEPKDLIVKYETKY
jgi:DNA-binding Xre family transcriptional regulator